MKKVNSKILYRSSHRTHERLDNEEKSNNESSLLDEADQDNPQNISDENDYQPQIGGFMKFILWFRVPNIFEIFDFISIFIFLWNVILKIVYEQYYHGLEIKENKFLELGEIEIFQYSILTIDNFILIFICFGLAKYFVIWIPQMQQVMDQITSYAKDGLIYVFITINGLTLLFSMYLMITLFEFHYGYVNYLFAYLSSINLFTSGKIVNDYQHEYFLEDAEYFIRRTNFLIFITIMGFHFLIRLVISISAASYLKHLPEIRERVEKKQKIEDAKEAKIQRLLKNFQHGR